jgi:hypothetical protein
VGPGTYMAIIKLQLRGDAQPSVKKQRIGVTR